LRYLFFTTLLVVGDCLSGIVLPHEHQRRKLIISSGYKVWLQKIQSLLPLIFLQPFLKNHFATLQF